MNELWQNMQDFDSSDAVRVVIFGLVIWVGAALGLVYPTIKLEATERLRNLYYGVAFATLTFGVGAVEGYLRNRGQTFTLYMILSTMLFLFTGFRTGKANELFNREVDRGFESGSGQNSVKKRPDA